MRYLFNIVLLFILQAAFGQNNYSSEALNVVKRTFGDDAASKVLFKQINEKDNNFFSYEVKNNKLLVSGNSAVAMCKGFYDYLKTTGQGMYTWGGRRLNISNKLKNVIPKFLESPYKLHYYFNVVTNGYTTPYWDWHRWEKELDWMSLHGMDLLMLNGAYESIMWKVFKKIGLTDFEIGSFFTGPAFNPWNRMGNISGWDGPAPKEYYSRQIILTHKILNRMRALGIKPIVQSFAGFVPKELKRIHPEVELKELSWEGFESKYRTHILMPDNKIYKDIGKLFIDEWQNEFGKETYFIADSFNEMKVPANGSIEDALSNYGETTYRTIEEANPEAIWVLQGWTFPYFKDETGQLFWTKSRLKAFLSKVPDDKILILDLGNEYNLLEWNISPSWKTFDGFFNKSWVYSFAPNMGGKTPWNGDLKTYASAPIDALHYKLKGNLKGYGFAPEGIENNELVYELLADMGWSDQPINVEAYVKDYCNLRYGTFSESMKVAFNYFLKSCYGTFNGHPRFAYQLSPDGIAYGSVNKSREFFKGVKSFGLCSNLLKNSPYYKNDLIEVTAQALSLICDSLLKKASTKRGNEKYLLLNKAYEKLLVADRLLQSHSTLKLSDWLNFAANWGDNITEKNYYQKNAKRIITRWGGQIRDYSARMWGGLLYNYYVPRLKAFYAAEKRNEKFDAAKWEDNWINNSKIIYQNPYKNPIQVCKNIIANF